MHFLRNPILRRPREVENPWIHGGLAVVMACLLMVLSFHLPLIRRGVDGVVMLLRIPEYPARYVRTKVVELRQWIDSQERVYRRIATLEKNNLMLRTALAQYTLYDQVQESLAKPSFLAARILARHPMTWWDDVTIDVGTSRGVAVGDPVLHEGYLVGRVSRVGAMDASVRLLTSQNFSIPVTVEKTRDLGVLTGDGKGNVLLRYIPEDRSLPLDSPLITALLDTNFPSGIPIGTLGARNEPYGGFRSYMVRPGVPFSRLFRVSVMIKEETP